jgi:ribose/xylose/arabinose/galactoside ABC-type transport system permease subunit
VVILDRFNATRARTITAWVLLVGSLIGWPVSMLTVARGEPPFVLSLSWLAIVIESASLLTSAQVRENQDDS